MKTTTTTTWAASDISQDTTARELKGRAPIIEFQDRHGNWHEFAVVTTPSRVVFGGACNVGFLESGYIVREDHESLDETVSELIAELATFYNDGNDYTSRIVVNERM